MQQKTVAELADVMTIYFQQLVIHTHECVTQYFNDGENYKHYFSSYVMIYIFYLVDEVCNKYSLSDIEHRITILENIFSRSFSLSDEEAKHGAFTAANLGMDATKRTVEQDWKLGQIIYRMAKRDADAFNCEDINKQQLDNFNILALLENHPKDEEFTPMSEVGGRNNPCLCGSGKRYKHCCGKLR